MSVTPPPKKKPLMDDFLIYSNVTVVLNQKCGKRFLPTSARGQSMYIPSQVTSLKTLLHGDSFLVVQMNAAGIRMGEWGMRFSIYSIVPQPAVNSFRTLGQHLTKISLASLSPGTPCEPIMVVRICLPSRRTFENLLSLLSLGKIMTHYICFLHVGIF